MIERFPNDLFGLEAAQKERLSMLVGKSRGRVLVLVHPFCRIERDPGFGTHEPVPEVSEQIRIDHLKSRAYLRGLHRLVRSKRFPVGILFEEERRVLGSLLQLRKTNPFRRWVVIRTIPSDPQPVADRTWSDVAKGLSSIGAKRLYLGGMYFRQTGPPGYDERDTKRWAVGCVTHARNKLRETRQFDSVRVFARSVFDAQDTAAQIRQIVRDRAAYAEATRGWYPYMPKPPLKRRQNKATVFKRHRS